jgi:hypothetical protein
VLDVLWTRHSAPLGTLVRDADDFVVMCRTKRECEPAEERIRVILERLGGSSWTPARKASTSSAVICTSA